MKIQNLRYRRWNYATLAFGVTFLCFVILMIVKGFVPFGQSSMLYTDSYHQYYPFFLAFRRALRSGDSLLYSWNVGMGMDYLGLISYYLASPLNLFSILLPENWMLSYFSLLTPIKLSFASLFFSLFLQKTFRQNDLGVTLFGCFYGLCAWALAYLWNIMWLDTFALVPLVILGMVSLLTERKFVLYTVSLFLSIFSNYYIGLFTCIFVLLAFFCYEICNWSGFRKFFFDLFLMGVFSVLAIAMTAILALPTLAALKTTQSSINEFPKGFKLNIASENTCKGLFNAMGQVAGNMNGGLEPSFKEGLPNLYCGVFANALAFLFLYSDKVKTRDKLCTLFLLLFFNLSFIIRQLDYIWHGFHFTNMIPYRFSFLHSFVLLYMAYRAYLLRDHFTLPQICVAAVLSVGLIALSESRTDWMYLVYNGAFLLLYIFLLVYPRILPVPHPDADEKTIIHYLTVQQFRRDWAERLLVIVIALEMILNLVNFGSNFPGTTTAFYPRGKEYSASIIRYMHEREWNELFFRAETTHTQTLNDGALNNYNGISTFTSSANVKTTTFMRKLGLAAKETFNRYCYTEGSPVSNLFLGIKYMIERSGQVEENPYFDDLHSYGDVHLLKNNAYLPLGFLANSELGELSFEEKIDIFEFQNQLFTAATGMSAPVWDHMDKDTLSITASDVNLTSTTSDGYCVYNNDDSSGTITYQYIADHDGFMCFMLNQSVRNNFTVHLNGNELYAESYTVPQMFAAAQVYEGNVVEIRFACNSNESGNIRVTAAQLKEDIFRTGYNVLSQSVLELEHFSNTKVDGSILCNRDGLLYTSIPQNGNWQAYVDGEAVEPILVGDAMIGIPLTKGYHEVSFRYHNNAFSLGWKITALSAAVFAGLYFFYYRSSKKKGKYAK